MPTALITGATAGIGAAFARRLAADGFHLILLARDGERLARTAEDCGNAEVVVADLATDEGLAKGEEAARHADLVVNNAGFGHKGRFLEVPLEDELTMLRVHCEAVLRLTYAALPGMRERGRGGVINVASVAAFFSRGTYGASKAWVVGFSQGVAADVPGVHVMALCPGFVHTEFHDRARMNVSRIPEPLWLDADRVVADALRDLRRGVTVSVPGAQYKALVGLGKLIPRNLAGRLSSRTGRRYD
ncbi:SDR family NAD(P)-dependent oxidoreductase [Actinoallomurus rhizosphaericola]|uniref:SDR family NAD(P)-dependent oxidoreductase n=1 Tax=Actinoallomurus rhizosphaericola TaxID=2952536 RepID=UPI0020911535|nr:SDR family NAD(P)-dependent oxidoreductase [Actinoallomurus rhizosphaericola]MCO5993303.1 SDR family NAD(P)-dependent oxidoreductase [Actinoallomurus rhizosphaericola]